MKTRSHTSMAGENNKSALDGVIRGVTSGAFKGIKLGPGVIGNLSVVAIALFVGVSIVGWGLSNTPLVALAAILALILFALYLVERLVRFAHKNPAAAVLGGAEFYHHLKDQMAAKDPKVITSDEIVGAGPVLIDHQANRDA